MVKKVLLIDDDPRMLEIIGDLLEETGYAVIRALSFEAAVQKTKATVPDLVLTDVVMPDMSGFEACRKIKALFQPPPPVFLMTCQASAIDFVLAQEMGADDFVVKSSDMGDLLSIVQQKLDDPKTP